MKNVLITGAAGALGSAVVDKFLQDGDRVIAAVGSPPTTSRANVHSYVADLTQEAATAEMVARAVADHGPIDAALLLVGGYAGGNLDQTDGALLRKMMSLNFETAYFVARPVFQHMAKNGGGRIVLVASKTALVDEAGKNNLAYALSKFMLTKLATLLNAEGADKNIVCHVIAPSTIDTEANRKAMPKADFTKWVAPAAIAETLAFLVGEKGAEWRDAVVKVYGGS